MQVGNLLLLGSQGRQPVSSQLLGSQAALQQSGCLPLQHLLPLQLQRSQEEECRQCTSLYKTNLTTVR